MGVEVLSNKQAGRASFVKMDLAGISPLLAKLRKMDISKSLRVLKKAVNAAGTPVVKAARKLAPKQSGFLAKAIVKKGVTYRQSGTIVSIIGVDKNMAATVTVTRNGRTTTRYERPSKIHHIHELGGKFIVAKGYLKQAIRSTAQSSVDKMSRKIGQEIEKELAKGGKKGR